MILDSWFGRNGVPAILTLRNSACRLAIPAVATCSLIVFHRSDLVVDARHVRPVGLVLRRRETKGGLRSKKWMTASRALLGFVVEAQKLIARRSWMVVAGPLVYAFDYPATPAACLRRCCADGKAQPEIVRPIDVIERALQQMLEFLWETHVDCWQMRIARKLRDLMETEEQRQVFRMHQSMLLVGPRLIPPPPWPGGETRWPGPAS
jgi:hypothetical protein